MKITQTIFVFPFLMLYFCVAKVRKVDAFKSLDEYLMEVTIKKALPGITSIEEARRIYHQWSTPQEIETYGFLGIWIDRQTRSAAFNKFPVT